MPERAWSVTTAIDNHREPRTVFAETRGKAAYQTLLEAQEPYPDLQFKHIRVRSLGILETPFERAQRKAQDFNSRYPVGTPVRAYPGLMGDHDSAYDTIVKEPGAYVTGGRDHEHCYVTVKVPGDSIALTHVIPLVPLSDTPTDRQDGGAI